MQNLYGIRNILFTYSKVSNLYDEKCKIQTNNPDPYEMVTLINVILIQASCADQPVPGLSRLVSLASKVLREADGDAARLYACSL